MKQATISSRACCMQPVARRLGQTLKKTVAIVAAAVVTTQSELAAAAPQAPDTLRLDEAIGLVRALNPELQAARLRADASLERVPQAGALPEPQVMFALMNRPVDDFGTTQPMTMNSVQLMQRVPWPGKLGFSQRRAEYLAAAEQEEANELENALIARVQGVYFELAHMDRALAIMRATRELLRDFHRVSSAVYAVGTGLQQDVLQAQVSIASMTEDIKVMEQNRVAGAARLNALLDRDATVPIGALELLPPREILPTVDSLMAIAVEQRPALRAAAMRVDAAEAGYRAARRTLYPDFTFTVAYGQRPQFVDFVTFMVGVNIPLWAGSRQLPARREMLAMQAEADAHRQHLYNETYARLAEARAEAERALSLVTLYESSIVPQAQAAVQASLAAYRVGRVDYTTLITNQLTVNRYEIESVRLTATYHRAVAQIEALIAADVGGAP